MGGISGKVTGGFGERNGKEDTMQFYFIRNLKSKLTIAF